MVGEINKAVAMGPTPDGFRHFGAALHVLEDYFAHSNFVELSLRKVGHVNVLPWTSNAPGKHPYPVVTGMFASEDVIASTAGLIADNLFKVKWEFEASQPYVRTKADRIMLIVLREHGDQTYYKQFQSFLSLRDKWAQIPGHRTAEWVGHHTVGQISNLYNFVYNSLTHLLGNSVDDLQVLGAGDPNKNGSTDPSHSQLAKDHDHHPFHTLAALLAKDAVRDVGTAIARRWRGDLRANPSAVAAGYLVHPNDSTWQDQRVVAWANSHPASIKRGESATEWEALRAAHEREVRDRMNSINTRARDTWNYINKYYEQIFGSRNQVKR